MLEEENGAATFDAKAEAARLAERLINRAAGLIGDGDHRDIVAALCASLTQETPHIRLAWTWFGHSGATVIAPQIISGPAAAYAESLTIEDNPLTREGPAFRALTGRRTAPVAILTTSPFAPWRRAAAEFGIRAALALPLRSKSEHERGLFVLYADLPTYFDEVGLRLFESLAELFGALLSAASDRQSLRTTARSDALTGLGNRHMSGDMERVMFRVNDASPKATVLLLDVDHFKAINDVHGHDIGDRVLREIAHQLRSLVRGNDCVLRWGGEEFLICLPDTSAAQGVATAEKIREALAAVSHADGLLRCTVSIGAAEVAVGTTLSSAIRRADEALYRAKREGRNCVRCH